MNLGLKGLGCVFLILLAACAGKGTSVTTHMDYDLKEDPKTGKMIVGHFPRELLESHSFPWFSEKYKKTKVQTKDLKLVQSVSEQLEVLVFMGTWCPDSKNHVPEFVKILDEAQVSKEKVVFIATDRSKVLGSITQQFKIEKLPTFVFLAGGSEIGRITEHPKKTLLEDVKEIFDKAVER